MNFKVFIILCVVVMLLFPDTEGWRRRRRRRTCHRSCSYVCSYYCYTYGGRLYCIRYCRYVCRTQCFGKREVPEESADDKRDPAKPSSGDVKINPIPLPAKFSDYDKNGDGRISLEEFKNALPPVKDKKPIRKEFSLIDKNGDSHIDCKEFLLSNLNSKKVKSC